MQSTPDFLEIDFLAVETAKSGDAITIRYRQNGSTAIHVVDGGFTAMGETIADHLASHYGAPTHIHNVVLTHPDGDHALGLKHILDTYDVGTLWMNRPWLYASELIHRFSKFTNVENLAARLKEIYSHTAALEELAEENGIQIREAFQGTQIGIFTVMAPSRSRYLDLVVESERTPEAVAEASLWESLLKAGTMAAKAAANLVKAAWGTETFSPQETSAENEMSIVQYANFSGEKILLTGDAGRGALKEVIDYAPWVGLSLPGIDRFQVPHHGSRRNVSTDLLNSILGPQVVQGTATKFSAFISSAKADPDHPRKSVIRAMHHRGGKVMATEGVSIRTGVNAPARDGWGPIEGLPYPDEEEE